MDGKLNVAQEKTCHGKICLATTSRDKVSCSSDPHLEHHEPLPALTTHTVADLSKLSVALARSAGEETYHHQDDKAALSIYTRLKSLFSHKNTDVAILTPPASPQNTKADASPPSYPPLFDHSSSLLNTGPPLLNSPRAAVTTSQQWTPLTPESIGHSLEHGLESSSWSGFVRLSAEFTLGDKDKEAASNVLGSAIHVLPLPDGLNVQTNILDVTGHGLPANPRPEPEPIDVSMGPDMREDRLVSSDGIHLTDDEDDPARARTKSMQRGKSRAPPIPWEVLIDDLSSPVSPTRMQDESAGHPTERKESDPADVVYYPGDNVHEDDFYDLQYALELSRQDRRKMMDSDPGVAGEFSKSRQSWAILHLHRVMPADQEYWFQHWLQWHHRLEEKQAIKLYKRRKKLEYDRYQMVNPWPLTDRHTARHPRHADEDMQPNLRLMRHRTRSAPGRIRL